MLTILSWFQMWTPDIPLLDNPDLVTSVVEPPSPTQIIGPPPDTTPFDDATRPAVGTAAWSAVIAALGLAVFVL